MDEAQAGDSGGGASGEFIPARTMTGEDGRVLVFSCDQFVEQICNGDCCFVCGKPRDPETFNDEHVIPAWLLRRFKLFDRQVTLYDGQVRTYGQYKLPCCIACNSLLGDQIETPVSKLLAGGFDDVVARLNSDGIRRLFVWLCLLFLKTHLKDRSVPQHSDPRRSEGWLADEYYWPEMHHLHCVARVPYVQAEVEREVIGTVAVFQVHDEAVIDTFDYADLTGDQTVMVRLGDFAIIAVLNDSGAAHQAWEHRLSQIDGPVSNVQLRELSAMLATANSDLINRPIYGTSVEMSTGQVRLWARHEAAPDFAPFDPKKLGDRLAAALRGHYGHLSAGDERNPKAVEALIRAGEVTYLWDAEGRFRPADLHWEEAKAGRRG